MATYPYELFNQTESRQFTYTGGITGTVRVSLKVNSSDAVVKEGTQLEIIFSASESDTGSGGGLGGSVGFTVFGENQLTTDTITNTTISKTVYKTYSLSNMQPSSSGYNHLVYADVSAPSGASVGLLALNYWPNIAPTVSITPPSKIYAGATMSVRVSVSDYENDPLIGGYPSTSPNYNRNSRIEAIYNNGGSITTKRITESLTIGTTDYSFVVPKDYAGGTVYFRAFVLDAYDGQGTAQTSAQSVLMNLPPTANLTIEGVAAGQTATLSWTFNDPERHSVSTKSLVRYYQAANSSAWQEKIVTSSSVVKSITDFIPASYNGGSIYYVLKFVDEYGAEGEQRSSTYQLQTITPPTVPPSIVYPLSIAGGEAVTVQWGKSSDAENNISGYEVDRSYNGSSWTNIYRANQPNTLSTSVVVDYGNTYVWFRVRAFDTTGKYSEYAVGDRANVVNNQRPTVPDSITVPANIATGQAVVVKWGSSIDPDGDAITYVLERKINRGTYAVATQTQALNFTDTVGATWQYVQYRVKAVDSKGLSSSAYKESPERTVSQNNVPTITCEYTDNQDLGVKNQSFSVTYSVNDADLSDTLTVKEYLDGVQIKSYTATRETNYAYNFLNGAKWQTAVNGEHKITITVSDGKATARLRLTFTKAETGCVITLTNPVVLPKNAYYSVLSISYTLPYENQWVDGSFNLDLFNSKFKNGDNPGIDVYCIGATATVAAGDWESCEIDTSSSYTQDGNTFIQGNNILIALREGHVIMIHKFSTANKQFNYRIFANTNDVDDLGHICSVQGSFGFTSITIPT